MSIPRLTSSQATIELNLSIGARKAEIVAKTNPADVDALLASRATTARPLTNSSRKYSLNSVKIYRVRRFVRYEGHVVVTYVHAGGKIGVMVKFDTDVADKDGFVAMGKNVAMQIAAMNPAYLDEASLFRQRSSRRKKGDHDRSDERGSQDG